MKVSDYLLDTLERNGVAHIFGNPGTTEIPLVRACEQRKAIRYVVALSEVAAVPMADGYARSTRRLGVVNLHVAPGLGNGMGNLYTAGIAGTPLLVLVGGQDRRFLHTDPILWGPLRDMAAAVCKRVFELDTRHDAAANVKRAVRAALAPPYAPVALVCPPDLLEQEIEAHAAKVEAPSPAGLDADEARRFAAFLRPPARPALIAAEDVVWSGAQAALERLAHKLGAPVFAAPYTGVLPIAATSPCYAGYLPPSLSQIATRLAPYDALLFVGGRGLRTTLYSDGRLPQRKAWLGHDASAVAAEDEFELARVADPQRALNAIAELVDSADAPASTLRPREEPPAAVSGAIHPSRAVHRLLDRFADAMWVDESGLSTSDVRQWLRAQAGDYLINGSGGIGWGVPAAVGAALGNPDRRVVALIGDGSALYASEAMWTAAHHGTRLVLVVLANRRYATLNEAATRLAGGSLSSFTMEPPQLDFSGLAKLHGWSYACAATEDELESHLPTLQDCRGNLLLELRLDPAVKPASAARHF